MFCNWSRLSCTLADSAATECGMLIAGDTVRRMDVNLRCACIREQRCALRITSAGQTRPEEQLGRVATVKLLRCEVLSRLLALQYLHSGVQARRTIGDTLGLNYCAREYVMFLCERIRGSRGAHQIAL